MGPGFLPVPCAPSFLVDPFPEDLPRPGQAAAPAGLPGGRSGWRGCVTAPASCRGWNQQAQKTRLADQK